MERHEKYKPSGVEWIEEIPQGWKMQKLKHTFAFQTGFTPATGNKEYYDNGDNIWITISDMTKRLVSDSSQKITSDAIANHNTNITPKGSLLYSFKLSVGKVAFAEKDCYTNEAIFSILPTPGLNLDFYYYSLPSQVIMNANENIYGAKLLNQDLIKNANIIVPPIEEQQAIAEYLDEKCGAIDALIERKERLLELYAEKRQAIINRAVTRGIDPNAPLKDSGIPYLGQIPAHWEVKKLKNIVSKIGSGVTPTGGSEVYQTEGIPLLRSQNIYFDGLRLDDVAYISIEIDESMSNSRVKDGDVLLNITGGSIGRCYYIPQGFGSANVNQHVCIIRSKFNLVGTKYLNMLIGSNVGQEQIELQQTGANREGLNFEQLKGFNIPLPDLKEQAAIVSHIEEKCGKIDQICEKLRQQIVLYREYRTALIANAVTGKIKI